MSKTTVRCLDGEVRHSAPFATVTAAISWAATGHRCAPARFHDLLVTDRTGVELTLPFEEAVQIRPALDDNASPTVDELIGMVEIVSLVA